MRTAVIGAGTMGSGIAQAAAMAGHRVALHDPQPAALERAEQAVRRSLDRFVRSERIDAAAADAAAARIAPAATLADAVAAADVVVEAAPESLELKREIFAAVAAAAPATRCSGPTPRSSASQRSARRSATTPSGWSACTSSTRR